MNVRMKLRRSPLEVVAQQVMMVLRKGPFHTLKNMCHIVLVVWHSLTQVIGSKGLWWSQKGQR